MYKSLAIAALLVSTASCSLEQKPAPFVEYGDKKFSRNAVRPDSNYANNSDFVSRNTVGTSFDSAQVQSYDLSSSSSDFAPLSRNDEVIDFGGQQQNSSNYGGYQTSQSRPIASDYIDAPSNAGGEYSVNQGQSFQSAAAPARARPIIDTPKEKPAYESAARINEQKPASGYIDLSPLRNFDSSQASTSASANSKLSSISPLSKPIYSGEEVQVTSYVEKNPSVVRDIQPVEKIAIPSPPKSQEIASVAPSKFEAPKIASSGEDDIDRAAIIESPKAKASDKLFLRPIAGDIIGKFGNEPDGTFNDGIKIKAAKGSEVKAADGGEVVYAGNQLQGYGNMVIIRHPSGFLTSYAHLEGLDIQKGTKVSKGQKIGRVGDTGNVSEPQLHFGIREGREPVDPQKFL